MTPNEMTPGKWNDLLKDWFRVPGYSDVYVLGCFAKHVTLYAQQVRALNLITGLVQTGSIAEGRDVVVIGGGAAGLTAACGAAKHKAKVLLLEEQEQVMELQRNNRQRWIHPHIYYWPEIDPRKSTADLPFLPWKADYAASVTRDIEEKWEVLKELFGIGFRPNVREVNIAPTADQAVVTWVDDADTAEPRWRENPVIILAVGFGLEPQSTHQDSYWMEDDIDGNFRRSAEHQRWLVSGFGDGALTDLMRLCIRQFRHADIVEWFERVPGIEEIKQQLIEIHAHENLNARVLTNKFYKLQMQNLMAALKPRLRKHGPQVFLAGHSPFPYGPESSILNRLVVRVLAQIPKFSLLTGPTDANNIKPVDKKFRVQLGSEWKEFDRVIVRHGPTPPTLESSFGAIWNACADLKSRWKTIPWQKDVTRNRLWPDGFFGPEMGCTPADQATPPPSVPSATILDPKFQEAVERFGVQVSVFEVRKKIRDDGVATAEYMVSGLKVVSGELRGMRFYYESTFGQVGGPMLDATSLNAGFVWKDDDVSPSDESDMSFDGAMATLRERVRKMSGTVFFPATLTPSEPPLSFSLSFSLAVTVLNSDALSTWEFEQLYELDNRKHVNGDALTYATEYWARVVWFPVSVLKLALTLPTRSPGPAFPSLFTATHRESIPKEQVVVNDVLEMYPPNDSAWALPGPEWLREPADDLVQGGQFVNVAPQTWELSVSNPSVGSCYSLDWRLPSSSAKAETMKIAAETTVFRVKLLAHREQRLNGKGNFRVQTALKEFYAKLEQKYRKDPDERFALSMMAYDEHDHRLKLVEGVVNRGEPSGDMWEFWLPFGAGLAGACFKQQVNNALIYFAPTPQEVQEVKSGPEVYFPFPNRERHTVLIALPLKHPEYVGEDQGSSFESARVRMAVIDIASNSVNSHLLSFKGPAGNNNFRELIDWCTDLSQHLCTVLREEKTEKL